MKKPQLPGIKNQPAKANQKMQKQIGKAQGHHGFKGQLVGFHPSMPFPKPNKKKAK